MEILCGAFKEFENRSVILHAKEGSALLLPLVENKKGLGLSTWLSLPYGTYGGPIVEQGGGPIDWALVREYLQDRNFAAENMTLPPGVEPPRWQDYTVSPLTTQVLDLRDGYEALYNGFNRSCRKAIRRAERSQIEIQLLDQDRFLEPLIALYEQNVQYWGLRKGFPHQLFPILWNTPNIHFWGALRHGRLVAAVTTLTHNTHQYAWIGIMDRDAQIWRPNNMLYARLLEQGCREGIETFDFGNSNGIPGVFFFKKIFDPKVLSFNQIHRAGPLISKYHWLRGLFEGQSPEQ